MTVLARNAADLRTSSRPYPLPKIPSALLLAGMAMAPVTASYQAVRDTGEAALRQLHGTVRLGQGFFTRSSDDLIVLVARTDSMTFTKSLPTHTTVDLVKPSLKAAAERLSYLRSLDDGWQGEGSVAASQETGLDAGSLLEKLSSEIPERWMPQIGLDSDGFIVMSWDDEALVGSLSVFGDGTYAYFLRRGAQVVKAGEVRISDPISHNLIELLTA